MKIVIPMAGEGKRFKDAGFREIKPLIDLGGKPMIQRVTESFPDEAAFIFICRRQDLDETPLGKVLKGLKPSSRIIALDRPTKGPVDTFLQAAEEIPDDEELIINYCDFAMEWDFRDFLAKVRKEGIAGALPAFRGFHPASLGDTYYAYMLVDERGMLKEIREKRSFSEDRTADLASTGTHYFSSGYLAKKYASETVREGIEINGEYYFSMPFNLMVKDGLGVLAYEVRKFICFGTPRDVREFRFWCDVFLKSSKSAGCVFDFTTLIPAAGRGQRFRDAGFDIPKPMIPVNGKPMIVEAVSSLPETSERIFVCLEEQLKAGLDFALSNAFPGCRIIPVKETTQGMVNTCLLAEKAWDTRKPLLISACDYGLQYDVKEFNRLIADKTIDVIVWTFRNHECVARNPDAYEYVELDENGFARRIAQKRPISATPVNDHALTSVFWFRTPQIFKEGAEALIASGKTVKGEYYIGNSINELIAAGKKVVPFEVGKFICWGTPDDLKEYEYWQDYFLKSK